MISICDFIKPAIDGLNANSIVLKMYIKYRSSFWHLNLLISIKKSKSIARGFFIWMTQSAITVPGVEVLDSKPRVAIKSLNFEL